ncbi:uncharacterized protein LOC131330570 [Rhododendron vialii]|uniref:uncharacterized protein LOC131330570 n=1 Tax=Rhododendron vialii TaxID=182163 RepID=UPI00265ED568|nr:uncharacterized protein LOC131330570 [Rhododendron vialii]
MGRQLDLICGLGEQESSLKPPLRSGIDPRVAIFASAALPVNRPSEGSENSIEVPRQHQTGCGCKHPCKCNPCHCNGFAIDPNAVPLVASVAPPVLMMPSEGSKKSIKAKREGIHPKL